MFDTIFQVIIDTTVSYNCFDSKKNSTLQSMLWDYFLLLLSNLFCGLSDQNKIELKKKCWIYSTIVWSSTESLQCITSKFLFWNQWSFFNSNFNVYLHWYFIITKIWRKIKKIILSSENASINWEPKHFDKSYCIL